MAELLEAFEHAEAGGRLVKSYVREPGYSTRQPAARSIKSCKPEGSQDLTMRPRPQ